MRHTVGIVVAQVVRTLAPLVTLPLISRAVPLPEFSTYVLFLTLAQAASVIVDFGFSFTGYALVEKAAVHRTLFARITAIRLAAGLAVGVAMVATTLIVAPQTIGFALAAAAYALALGCSPLWYMNWRRATAMLVLYESLPVMAMLGAAALTFFIGLPPLFVLLAGAAGGLVGPLLLSVPVWPAAAALEAPDTTALLRSQTGVALGRLVVVGYTVAIIPLGAALGLSSAVGQYAAVEKLGSVMGVLGIIVAQWMAPQIVSAMDARGRRRLIRRVALLAVAVPAAIALPLAFGGGPLLAAVFGPNFRSLDAGVGIVILASVFGYWTTLIWSGAALPSGITRGYLPIMAVGAIAAIVAMGASVPLGYLALCLSRLAAECVVLLASLTLLAFRGARTSSSS